MLLSTIVKAYRNVRVLCVGDVMLDKYYFGSVERISPEAPVPIVNIVNEESRLGGAANVANNIASLGGQAILAGAVGRGKTARLSVAVPLSRLRSRAGGIRQSSHRPAERNPRRGS